jgi:uncharacterized membrane protein YfcA
MGIELAVVSLTAFLTAILTFFSGFGLGTILLPVMLLFFPPEISVALTGAVHFLNNIFKLGLTYKNIDRDTALKFGIPAIMAAFAGANVLFYIPAENHIFTYTAYGRELFVTPLKLTLAVLLFLFALADLLPYFKKLTFEKDKLILGGVLSGFFGGLSGHQGALRSAFLIKAGLSKEAFVATGVAVSSCIDFTRLGVYFSNFRSDLTEGQLILVAAGSLSAFAGAFLGNKLLKKITLQSLQYLVAFALIIISFALGTGLI